MYGLYVRSGVVPLTREHLREIIEYSIINMWILLFTVMDTFVGGNTRSRSKLRGRLFDSSQQDASDTGGSLAEM